MKHYNIITLGPSGSGKTIFLASLYKVFSTQGKFGFSLDVQDPSKRKALNQIYADLTTGEKWPLGTRNISEWVLTSYVKNSELSKISACKITYVDYKGGIITDVSTEEINYGGEDNLKTYVQEADAVLAMLDGQKLLYFMKERDLSNKVVSRWLLEDLPNLMQIVDNDCNKYTPVHFIISKWDLLEGSYSLAEVKNRLLDTVGEFKNVVENRIKVGSSIRLIPVSSIGKNFAVLQPDGQMKKLSVNPHPINVEVPFAFALTDKLDNYNVGSKQKRFKFILLLDLAVFVLCLILISDYFARPLGIFIALIYFGIRLIYYLVRRSTKNKKNNQQRLHETLSSDEAFEQILSKCVEIKNNFNAKFPDSDLTKVSSFKSR